MLAATNLTSCNILISSNRYMARALEDEITVFYFRLLHSVIMWKVKGAGTVSVMYRITVCTVVLFL